MPDTEDQLGKRFRAITADLKLYIEKRAELLLLSVGEQYSRWFAESLQRLSGLVMLFGAFVFLLVALAVYLGEVLNNPSLGYVIVSFPLILFGILFYNLRPRSMTMNLQDHFEEELIKAITSDDSKETRRLETGENGRDTQN